MNIGLYFGSFNPIHKGHTALAQYLLKHCGLDEVWLMVSPNNPLKEKNTLWNEQLRLRLVQIAIHDISGLRASDFEFHLPRPSYTIDTLKALSKRYPENEFYLIMGSDNMTIFHQWKDYEKILSDYKIIVYPREGDDIESLTKKYPQMQVVSGAPLFPVSSTMIRQRLKEGKDISEYVDEPVNLALSEVGEIADF